MPTVLIVGGGISGLALAYRLQQASPTSAITLLEQQNRPGGKVWTERSDGFQIEHGPNGFLDTKPSTIQLCRDLGLGERLVAGSEAAARKRYLYLGGKLQLLPAGLGAFLRSNVLSWRGKLCLLAEPFRRGRRKASDESIAAFVRRRAGGEVADVLADAFVTGIFAGDPERLSVRASLPRLVALEDRYGSILRGFLQSARQRRAAAASRGEAVPRTGRMWSFREGLRLLTETLTARLVCPPLLGATARRLQWNETSPRWVVHGEGQDRWTADAVVLTCPAYQQAALLADLDTVMADQIAAIPYNRVAVVALGYRQSDVPLALDGFGFLAPGRLRGDLLGAQWCSSIYPDRAPPGMVLLRAMCGGWHRPEVAGWDDARLLAAVRADLLKALRIETKPVFHRIIRWERAIPQYLVGHLERVSALEERVRSYPGLFLGGNAYRGVALNDCTEQAQALAARVTDYLQR